MNETKKLTIAGILADRAEKTPDDTAFIYVDENGSESYTFKAFYEKAAIFASFLKSRGVSRNDRCILVFRQNIEVMYAFFACNILGASAVPLEFPDKDSDIEKLAKIVKKCAAVCVLTNDSEREQVSRISVENLGGVAVYSPEQSNGSEMTGDIVKGNMPVLQYTSGSTSEPKGVMVTEESLLNNLKQIQSKLHLDSSSRWVSWIPYHHDMGLIAGLLTSAYSGCADVFMTPQLFKKQPMKWLEVVSEFGGTHTVAPNFAFELMNGLLTKDLEAGNPKNISLVSVKGMLSGSEPIRFNTFLKFIEISGKYGMKDDIIRTGYGLAESTLVVSLNDLDSPIGWLKLNKKALASNIVEIAGSGRLCGSTEKADENNEDYTYLVGNGTTVDDNKVMVLDSDGEELPPLKIGEVCISGPTLAQGYMDNLEVTNEVFVKTASGETILHSGDAGFWGEDGELYITGRFKDMIVIHGENYFPADIEEVSTKSDPALSYGACVFSGSDEDEDSLVIVQEVSDEAVESADFSDIAEKIRNAVLASFSLVVKTVVLVRAESIPRTESRKIQHKKARTLFLENALEKVLYQTENQAETDLSEVNIESEDDLRKVITEGLAAYLGLSPDKIDLTMPFMQMGINSELSVKMVNKINTIPQIELAIADIFNYNTVEKFASYIYSRFFAADSSAEDLDSMDESELADLLAAELN